MADISVEEKQGSNLGWIWPVAAVIAVVALMAWLATTQETTTEVMTAAGTDTAAQEAPTATAEAAELDAVAAAPEDYVGRELAISDISVDADLGERAFWTQGGGNLFLVVAGDDVADVSWIELENTVSAEGEVRPLTDEDVNRLTGTGALHPDARDQVQIATHYFLISDVVDGAGAAGAAADTAAAQ